MRMKTLKASASRRLAHHRGINRIKATSQKRFCSAAVPITARELIHNLRFLDEFTAREIKGAIRSLRQRHNCPIGSRRGNPKGYFWIRSEADREIALREYREQIKSEWAILRKLDSPARLAEFHAQLTLGGE